MKRIVLLAFVLLVVNLGVVTAQDDQPMGQGEAAIKVRSDVKVAIRGTGGTPKVHLEKLGAAIAKAVPKVRKCYGRLVRKRATVTGRLEVTVTLPEGRKRVELALESEEELDKALQRCVMRELRQASFKDVPRPAAAVLTLGLDNTQAAGQSSLEEHAAVSNAVDVTTSPEGVSEASWRSQDGALSFHVRAKGPRGADAARSAIQGLRRGYAGFLDCRRRSEKGGLSPAGETQVKLVLKGRKKPKITVQTCGIRHERAPICMARAFRRSSFPDAPSGVPVDVTVTFAE